jgi:hypothetical protein
MILSENEKYYSPKSQPEKVFLTIIGSTCLAGLQGKVCLDLFRNEH